MADVGDEKHSEPPGMIEQVVAPKEKKKRLTPAERIAAIQKKANNAAQKARNRVATTAAKKNAKRTAAKSVAANTKKAKHNAIANAIRRKANNEGFSFTSNDIKIPTVAAKLNAVDKYFQAAKKRYYARTKKPTSIRRQALQIAQEQGIPEEYLKQTTRNKSAQEIIQRALKKMGKNTTKRAKSGHRAAILAYAEQSLGLNEKDTISAVCVRKKVEKK